MSTTTLSTLQPKRLPGPTVPAWTTWLTRLWPRRLEFDALAYQVTNARQYGDFYAIWLGEKPTYIVSSPEMAHEILVERAREFHKAEIVKNAVSPIIGNGLFTSDGDFWKRQRKLAQPAFHHHRIAAYGATMTQQTLDMLAEWQAGETRDIAQEMMKLTLGIVNKTLFNIDVSAQAERIGELMYILLEGANDRINSYDPIWRHIFKGHSQREAVAQQELRQIIDTIIAEHRIAEQNQQKEDTGDLLSMLLAARDEDGEPMSEKQLSDEVITLFLAGHETTANALAWSFYLLAKHPAAEQRLLQELAVLHGNAPTMADLSQLPYSEQVVKEAMRLYPPATGMARRPIHDIELGGYPIPAGSDVAISTYVMHHDARFFPDPERFDPERFTPENEAKLAKFSYLPFGAGPRVCIGNSFAMMEARLILATVLARFRLSLPAGKTVRYEQLLTLRPKGGLKMRVEKSVFPGGAGDRQAG